MPLACGTHANPAVLKPYWLPFCVDDSLSYGLITPNHFDFLAESTCYLLSLPTFLAVPIKVLSQHLLLVSSWVIPGLCLLL
jgi:hypothetical protein